MFIVQDKSALVWFKKYKNNYVKTNCSRLFGFKIKAHSILKLIRWKTFEYFLWNIYILVLCLVNT